MSTTGQPYAVRSMRVTQHLTHKRSQASDCAAAYIFASEDEFGQDQSFVADGFSKLVLHNIFDETASSWLVCDSAAKTHDNFDRSLLRCVDGV